MKTLIKKRIQRFATVSAQKLNDKAENWSPLKKKIALLLFCISFSAVSSYIILQAFVSTPIKSNSVFVHRIHIPVHIGKTNDKTVQFFVSPADFNRVELVKKCLDSLSFNDHKKYMEIMQ